MGKVLIGLGVALVVAGLLVAALERGLPGGGRLPGDLEFGGRNWRVHFPLATALIASVILTVLLNVLLWLMSRK
jgi:hypothetical protein